MDLKTIIKKPLITEKAMRWAQSNRYTFVVDQRANKKQIMEAVRRFLKVEPIRVWTMKIKGEERWLSGKRRRKVKAADFKKAIVELKKGQKLDFYESLEGANKQ